MESVPFGSEHDHDHLQRARQFEWRAHASESSARSGEMLVLGGKLLTQMGVLRSAAQQAGYGKRDLQAGAGYDVTSNMCGSRDVMWRTMPLRRSRQC